MVFGPQVAGRWSILSISERKRHKLALGLAAVIEDSTTRQSSSRATQNDHGELVIVVFRSGHHAGAMEEHGIVKEGALAFANAIAVFLQGRRAAP